MRTIKFKAKSLQSGEWVKGDLLQHLDGNIYIRDNEGPWVVDGLSGFDYNKFYRVDPSSVCQFTGFLDKNGKEIYEGDVLRSDKEPSGIFFLDKDPHMAVRYATPTEKKLLNNAVEKLGKRWDNVTQSLMPFFPGND